MKSGRWSILYEDEHCLVVDKPAGLLSIPDRYDPEIPNLLDSLLSYRESILVNHRLDKNTSGIILFSKTTTAHKLFSEMFENRKLDKHYIAIVHGTPAEEVGMINLPLSPSKHTKRGMEVNIKGKEALTKFRILKSWGLYSLLEIKLLTGRMHQIRVHLQAIHCPIVCDEMYGDGTPFFLSSIKKKYRSPKERKERPLLSRQALHASKLSFIHPVSGEEISIESELHKDMRAVIHQLDKNL